MIILISAAMISCGSVRSQGKSEIDSFVKSNFDVLDSVARALKNQRNLTSKQTAFLYLINGWVNSTAEFDHNKGFIFNEQHVLAWRRWYLKNEKSIDVKEFYKVISIYDDLFTNGIVPDEQLNYVGNLDKKYRSIDSNKY